MREGQKKRDMGEAGRETRVKPRPCWHLVVMNPQQKPETSFTSTMAQLIITASSGMEVGVGSGMRNTQQNELRM